MNIKGEHLRMLRGAFRMTVRDLAEFARIDKMTVVHIERGGKAQATTLDKIAAAFAPYVEFVEPMDGARGPGVILKPGFEAAVRGASQADADGDSTGSGLNSLAWDEAEDIDLTNAPDDDEPLPPLDWTDEERAEMLAMYRANPERWAALHEVSRYCLLRAMGVDSLNAGDSVS